MIRFSDEKATQLAWADCIQGRLYKDEAGDVFLKTEDDAVFFFDDGNAGVWSEATMKGKKVTLYTGTVTIRND